MTKPKEKTEAEKREDERRRLDALPAPSTLALAVLSAIHKTGSGIDASAAIERAIETWEQASLATQRLKQERSDRADQDVRSQSYFEAKSIAKIAAAKHIPSTKNNGYLTTAKGVAGAFFDCIAIEIRKCDEAIEKCAAPKWVKARKLFKLEKAGLENFRRRVKAGGPIELEEVQALVQFQLRKRESRKAKVAQGKA